MEGALKMRNAGDNYDATHIALGAFALGMLVGGVIIAVGVFLAGR